MAVRSLLTTLTLIVGAVAAPAVEWSGWSSGQPSPTPTSQFWQTWQPSPAISSPVSTSATSSASASSLNPCASVAQLVAASGTVSSTATPTVPAQLAFACLNSIPFNRSAAIELLESIDPYLQWQTTFADLANPPADYAALVQPAYNFNATWDAIKANTSAGAYSSEYEFGWTVYRATQLAHDGHFVLYPDSVTKIFSFGRLSPLVSTSIDGISAPQPYLYSDVLAHAASGASISPVTLINSEDAVSYLLVWSEYGSLQDPDALYNNLFWEPAQVALGSSGTGKGTFAGGGRGRWPYPGPTTSFTFANGSTLVQENFARVLVNFTGISSGEDIYQQEFIPPATAYQNVFEYASSIFTTASASASASASATAAASTSSTTTPAIPAPAYPTPYVQESTNQNSGYFLDGAGYDDIAVLAVRSFVGNVDDEIPFQAVNTYLIEQAVKLGKTKLIIDVSANGGGTILQGYDLFKQLFPSLLPYGASRYRYHETWNLLGEQVSYLAGLAPRSLDDNSTYQDLEAETWNYRTDVDVNYQNFDSWAAKAGPDYLGPDSPPEAYSSLIRWNLSDVLTPLNSGGIYVSGYLNRSNITTQPFAAENIVIVTDGYCASTCTIFSELMTNQGGVRTVALGGRPNGNQPMQAIGGVKGSNDLEYADIYYIIAEAYGASNDTLQAEWQNTVIANYNGLPIARTTAAVINARNAYLPNSNTPLQFVVQEADCRILYTPAMIVDETAVWKTVADSIWGGGNGNKCVAGSTSKRDVSVEARRIHAAADVDLEAFARAKDVETSEYAIHDGDSIMIP